MQYKNINKKYIFLYLFTSIILYRYYNIVLYTVLYCMCAVKRSPYFVFCFIILSRVFTFISYGFLKRILKRILKFQFYRAKCPSFFFNCFFLVNPVFFLYFLVFFVNAEQLIWQSMMVRKHRSDQQ